MRYKFIVGFMALMLAVAGASDFFQRARVRASRLPWRVSSSPEIAMMSG